MFFESSKDLHKYIAEQLEKTQNQFDLIKLTAGTSVLLAVVSLNSEEAIFQFSLWGWSSYRWILLLAVISLISVLLSFVIKERQLAGVSKHFSAKGLSVFQRTMIKYLYGRSALRYAKQEAFLKIQAPEILVSIFNNMATIALIFSLAIFAASVILGG